MLVAFNRHQAVTGLTFDLVVFRQHLALSSVSMLTTSPVTSSAIRQRLTSSPMRETVMRSRPEVIL